MLIDLTWSIARTLGARAHPAIEPAKPPVTSHQKAGPKAGFFSRSGSCHQNLRTTGWAGITWVGSSQR
jgi:hypothetical protein